MNRFQPAMVSLLKEQAKQTAKHKTRLDKGLGDTFAVSDPAPVTNAAMASGR